MRSVILSVTARDALMRVLSLSSYFIFISKNPAKQKRGIFLAAARTLWPYAAQRERVADCKH